jgi:hypothetical protein
MDNFMSQGRGKDKRPSWEVDWVRCELSKEQKEMLRKWDVKYERTVDVVTRLVSDGFKLTVWGDKSHDCVGVSLTTPKGEGGARQQCLSARGPDFLGALKAAAYKHSVVLEGDWGTLDNTGDPDSQWG